MRPEDFQNNYNQTLQTLRQLEQQAQGNDPTMVKDLQNLIRDMQRLNPNTYANDPLLAERIQGALMGGVQQVEMELRRKVEDANGTGSVRSAGGEKVPPGLPGQGRRILPQAQQEQTVARAARLSNCLSQSVTIDPPCPKGAVCICTPRANRVISIYIHSRLIPTGI